ncbi:MAG: DUF6492 family protein [Cyanophyceae cyanobacterium]
MAKEVFDFVIPLFQIRWNTRAVLEGLTVQYQPRAIHVIAPGPQARSLQELVKNWDTAPVFAHEEESFFEPCGLSKETICVEIDLGESLYTPGWFYQQLLKLGAYEGIENLSEWYVVWDSDLLPVDTWPLIQETESGNQHPFALLQHKNWGNPAIVGKWATWIKSVLGVEPASDEVGTFVPHHMWFKQEHLKAFAKQVQTYFESDDHWLLLMMRSANKFGTFSEYWMYVSWVAAKAPNDLQYHPYDTYGETTERLFDDGTGWFSAKLRQSPAMEGEPIGDDFSPSYEAIAQFIKAEYPPDPLPSSLSFESSPRHLKKDRKNMHIEESRSRWNPREDVAAPVQ